MPKERQSHSRETVHEARINLLDEASEGLYPTWDLETRKAGRPGVIEHDWAFQRLERAILRDHIARIKKGLVDAGLSSPRINLILKNATRESVAHNEPPFESVRDNSHK